MILSSNSNFGISETLNQGFPETLIIEDDMCLKVNSAYGGVPRCPNIAGPKP
jgi:hypothetical protein